MYKINLHAVCNKLIHFSNIMVICDHRLYSKSHEKDKVGIRKSVTFIFSRYELDKS